jgi:hypothetical protein
MAPVMQVASVPETIGSGASSTISVASGTDHVYLTLPERNQAKKRGLSLRYPQKIGN